MRKRDTDSDLRKLRRYGINVIDRSGIELHFDELEDGAPRYKKIDRNYSLAITPDNVWIVTNDDKFPIGWLGDSMKFVKSKPDMVQFFIDKFAVHGLESKRRLNRDGYIM